PAATLGCSLPAGCAGLPTLALLSAEQSLDDIGRVGAIRSIAHARLSCGVPLSAPGPLPPAKQAAQGLTEAAAVGAEQALAHLLELGIGGVGIVEDALHVRIDL